MKVNNTMTWEEAIVEAHQNKIKYYREIYCPDTYENSAKKVVKEVSSKKSFLSIVKNFIKKVCKIKICH